MNHVNTPPTVIPLHPAPAGSEAAALASWLEAPRGSATRLWESLLGALVVFTVFIQIIDGALPQLRMALTGGAVGAGAAVVKPLMMLACVAALVTYGLRILPRDILRIWLMLLSYLTFLMFFNEVHLDVAAGMTALTFVDTYGVILILPLAFTFAGVAREATVRKVLLISFVPLAALGLTQYLMNDFVVYPGSGDGAFLINNPTHNLQVRAFSLFSSPVRFGSYISFMAVLTFGLYSHAKGWASKTTWGLFFFVALAALFATLTRNAYVFTVEGLFASWLLYRRTPIARSLPLMFFGVSALIALVGATVSESDSAVTNTESLSQRFSQWAQYLGEWLQSDFTTAIFGTGMSQISRFNSATDPVVIDNLYVAVGTQIGIVGLVLLVALLWRLWIYLYEHHAAAAASGNETYAAVTALWSTCFAAGVFNIAFPTYMILLLLAFVVLTGPMIDARPARGAGRKTTHGAAGAQGAA